MHRFSKWGWLCVFFLQTYINKWVDKYLIVLCKSCDFLNVHFVSSLNVIYFVINTLHTFWRFRWYPYIPIFLSSERVQHSSLMEKRRSNNGFTQRRETSAFVNVPVEDRMAKKTLECHFTWFDQFWTQPVNVMRFIGKHNIGHFWVPITTVCGGVSYGFVPLKNSLDMSGRILTATLLEPRGMFSVWCLVADAAVPFSTSPRRSTTCQFCRRARYGRRQYVTRAKGPSISGHPVDRPERYTTAWCPLLVFCNSDNIDKTEVREARDREVAGENANYGAILSGSGTKSKFSTTNITNMNLSEHPSIYSSIRLDETNTMIPILLLYI